MDALLNTHSYGDKIEATVRTFPDFVVLCFTNTIAGTTREFTFDMFLPKHVEVDITELALHFNGIMGVKPEVE